MKVKFKKLHPDAILPAYQTIGAAGMDLHLLSDRPHVFPPNVSAKIRTGLSVEVPPGHMGVIAPRSGLGATVGIILGNVVGIIDSDYRGELNICLWNRTAFTVTIRPGDRVAQLMIVPVLQVEVEETNELSTTDRGKGGFGSTGKD